MQNMRDGMVPLDCASACWLESYDDMFTLTRRIVSVDQMNPCAARFPGVGDSPAAIVTLHLTGIADLPAHLGVTNRIVQHHCDFFIRRRHGDNVSTCMILIVAKKIR